MDKVTEDLNGFQAVFLRNEWNEWCDEDGKKANSFLSEVFSLPSLSSDLMVPINKIE